MAVAGKNPGTVSRTAHPVLPRTSIHRTRGGGIGFDRRRRETTAVARTQNVAGRGADVCGRRLAPDGARPGIFRRGARDAAAGGGRSAATAGVGAGAKGTAAAKSGFLAAWLLPLAPLLGIAAGVGAQCLIIRSTTTDRKDRLKQIRHRHRLLGRLSGTGDGGELAMHALGRHFEWSDRVRFVDDHRFLVVLHPRHHHVPQRGRSMGHRQTPGAHRRR